jgi:hypothetical protein
MHAIHVEHVNIAMHMVPNFCHDTPAPYVFLSCHFFRFTCPLAAGGLSLPKGSSISVAYHFNRRQGFNPTSTCALIILLHCCATMFFSAIYAPLVDTARSFDWKVISHISRDTKDQTMGRWTRFGRMILVNPSRSTHGGEFVRFCDLRMGWSGASLPGLPLVSEL